MSEFFAIIWSVTFVVTMICVAYYGYQRGWDDAKSQSHQDHEKGWWNE